MDSQMDAVVRWHTADFEALGLDRLYAILAARAGVFVVEQNCPYQDVDNLDQSALHVWAEAPGAKVLAYARIVAPGGRYAEPSIGRVLTTSAGRGRGLGRELMQRALEASEARFPGQSIRISAQQYLEPFYQELGFETVRGPYLEDDIPHLEMLRTAGS